LALTVQDTPFELQVAQLAVVQPAFAQTFPSSGMSVQVLLSQQSALVVQPAPSGMQAFSGAAQRRIPEASGTHGARLQHWSWNWQTCPIPMQQFAFVPFQPVVQVALPPPKHRQIWFESCLHTSDPLMPPVVQQLSFIFGPQRLPGGLQLPPRSQRYVLQVMSCASPVFTLQQSSVASQ
jgi:hypothetical protein